MVDKALFCAFACMFQRSFENTNRGGEGPSRGGIGFRIYDHSRGWLLGLLHQAEDVRLRGAGEGRGCSGGRQWFQ